MKLYTDPGAPNPRRLDCFLRYKNIELETQEVNLRDGENFADWFEEINPARTVPTLVLDDGTALVDTISICVYLEKQFPDKPLFGNSVQEFAEILGWCHRLYVYGLDAVAEIFRNQGAFFKDRALPLKTVIKQNPDLLARGKLRLNDFWIELETHLAGREFIVGNQISQADIDAWLTCTFAKWVNETVPEENKATAEWRARVKSLVMPS